MLAYFLRWDPKRLIDSEEEIKKIGIDLKDFNSYLKLSQSHLSHFPGFEQFVNMLLQMRS